MQTNQTPRTKKKRSNLNGKLQHRQATKYGLGYKTTKPPP